MLPLEKNNSDYVIGIQTQRVIHKNATMSVYGNGPVYTENINDPLGNENLKAAIAYYVEELLDSELPYAQKMFVRASTKAGSYAIPKVRAAMNEIIKDEVETFLGFKLYPIVYGPNGYTRMTIPNMTQTYDVIKYPGGQNVILGNVTIK